MGALPSTPTTIVSLIQGLFGPGLERVGVGVGEDPGLGAGVNESDFASPAASIPLAPL